MSNRRMENDGTVYTAISISPITKENIYLRTTVYGQW